MRIGKRSLSSLLALLAALILPSCRGLVKEVFKAPKIRVIDATFASNPFEDRGAPLKVILSLEVDNRNDYPLDVAYVAYCGVLGTENVADGENREEIRIGASGATIVKVPVTLRADAFRAALKKVVEARAISYEFNGSVGLRAGVFGVVRVPFSKTGSIDPLEILLKKRFGFN